VIRKAFSGKVESGLAQQNAPFQSLARIPTAKPLTVFAEFALAFHGQGTCCMRQSNRRGGLQRITVKG
jgi:hypothetical protein